ncbi:MAG: MetQ/NlpA family ABC transporter substrate-binding protein [Spirochaetaceae bacterium]|jgi:D-methionine transport system substrate-binding protein|nr:MetQ/NlpA family ABC transporter substrate-binding protein [Spirochaetaceae bacterium]
MKNRFWLISLVLAAAVVFAGCAKKNEKLIKIGATPVPHAVMLNLVKDDLAKQGYNLQIIEFSDYVQPNIAVENGELDANFFQHIPYLDSFNQARGFHLKNAGGIHIEPMGAYSRTLKNINDLPEGAAIAVPNDPSNEGRALLLLQSAGIITLNASSGLTATLLDIVLNPKKLNFSELEAAQLPRSIGDVDLAIINGNYAIDAGLTKDDALIVEGASSPYVNIIAVKEGNENSEKITALVKALKSKKIKDFISREYLKGEVVPAF